MKKTISGGILCIILLAGLIIFSGVTPTFPDQRVDIKKYCTMLGSLDDNEREAAVKALAKIGKPALPEIIKSLKAEGPYLSRMNAAKTLGLIKDKEAVKPLIAALSDEYAHVRREAVTALGNIGDKSATLEIIKVMETGNDDMLKAGAEALGRIKDKRAIGALKKLTNHSNPDVAKAAEEAVLKIGL